MMTSLDRSSIARPRRRRLTPIAGVFLAVVLPALRATGQECQNQAKIDVCKFGCTVTGDICGGLCDFTSGACWVGCQAAFGTCDAGCEACDLGCDICCGTGTCNCSSCRSDCNSCRNTCDNARDDCEDGCRLDCDACIFDCERDCESICRPFKKIGESCVPLVDRCADGLTCWPFLFQCFPSENDELYPDDECRSLYSSGIHQGAIDGNVAWSFGTGGASAVGISETLEVGNVYGPDGRYGCYFTICLGGTTDVEVGIYAATGIYISYDDFQGESIAFVEEAGEGIVFATSQIINTSGELIGTADALSIELSLSPVAVGVYDCTTIVDTVGIREPDGSLTPIFNSPPIAICDDRVVCADPDSCHAEVSIDQASVDPDGDPIVLVQDPPGPYPVGTHEVTLTVSDLDGASDTCTQTVQVDDCEPPQIDCPRDIVADCFPDRWTYLDPGDAVVTDCTEVVVRDFAPRSFRPGVTTTLTYSAEDAFGLKSMCKQTVRVTGDDTDGDGLIDCVDACPDSAPGEEIGPDGCPVEEPEPEPVPDSDGDGVNDDIDQCPDSPDGPVDEMGCPLPEPPPPPVDDDGDGVTDNVDLCLGTPAGEEVDEDGCPIEDEPEQPAPGDDMNGGPCGLLDLFSMLMIGMGLVGLRWTSQSRRR